MEHHNCLSTYTWQTAISHLKSPFTLNDFSHLFLLCQLRVLCLLLILEKKELKRSLQSEQLFSSILRVPQIRPVFVSLNVHSNNPSPVPAPYRVAAQVSIGRALVQGYHPMIKQCKFAAFCTRNQDFNHGFIIECKAYIKARNEKEESIQKSSSP